VCASDADARAGQQRVRRLGWLGQHRLRRDGHATYSCPATVRLGAPAGGAGGNPERPHLLLLRFRCGVSRLWSSRRSEPWPRPRAAAFSFFPAHRQPPVPRRCPMMASWPRTRSSFSVHRRRQPVSCRRQRCPTPCRRWRRPPNRTRVARQLSPATTAASPSTGCPTAPRPVTLTPATMSRTTVSPRAIGLPTASPTTFSPTTASPPFRRQRPATPLPCRAAAVSAAR